MLKSHETHQEAWLEPSFDIEIELRKKYETIRWGKKSIFMNNEVFGKTMVNVRKHKDNKFLIPKARRN